MSGKRSKRKGAAGERELAAELSRLLPGYDIKRGLSQARGGGAESADVVGLPGLHIECKRQKRPNIHAAMAQATADAKPTEAPTTMTKRDRETWLVTMQLEDWAVLYHAALIVNQLTRGDDDVRGLPN